MELSRRSLLVYAVLTAIWILVFGWQIQEHRRVRESARANLANRSKDIANTVSACIRGMRFRGTVLQERLEPLLAELVNGRTNELVRSSELVSIVLLNASGEPVASAGPPIDFSQQELMQRGERWGARTVTFLNPVDLGVSLSSEDGTNPVVILPAFRGTNSNREGPRGPAPREPRPEDQVRTNAPGPPRGPGVQARGDRPPRPEGEAGSRPRRPPWMRMDDAEFQQMIARRSLHGLALAMSTGAVDQADTRDLWIRSIILVLASISVLGSGLAWSNLARSAELQLRLVRASEMNSHLREMNLAAAGLAHETRNPLNIIRGLAQMISKQPETTAEVREKSRAIVDEADKVAAQLNEFINYSRPREVRRVPLAMGAVIQEVANALSYDLEEKNVKLLVKGDQLTVEADEQLLRQALFNLLINAIQAVDKGGEIQVAAARFGANQARLEVRDNGPGVPAAHRTEIFKPYVTMQKNGTGLGLAVVQQIVLAHGWEIQCLNNEPRGALFRIDHIKTRD